MSSIIDASPKRRRREKMCAQPHEQYLGHVYGEYSISFSTTTVTFQITRECYPELHSGQQPEVIGVFRSTPRYSLSVLSSVGSSIPIAHLFTSNFANIVNHKWDCKTYLVVSRRRSPPRQSDAPGPQSTPSILLM